MEEIKIFKAQPIGDQIIPDIQITISTPFPEINTISEHAEVMDREADRLHIALLSSLPGGLYDRLYVNMTKHQASLLVIRLPMNQDELR